jgi:diacylglycerol kinase family enzyme
MRATLVHNPAAGSAEPAGAVEGLLRGIGWQVVRRTGAAELDAAACRDVDVVVVAGGDGTVGRVARYTAGSDTPIAIVPMGTANNVARSLGVGLDVARAISGLATPETRRVDLGRFQGAGADGEQIFLEGLGLGVFAHFIGRQRQRPDEPTEKLRSAIHHVADALETYRATRCEIELDGRDRSGRYLLVAAMNMQALGPGLLLAPRARWDDGALDVVLVGPEYRHELAHLLRRGAEDECVELTELEAVRARQVRVRGRGLWSHADNHTQRLHGEITLDVRRGALRMLLPKHDGR